MNSISEDFELDKYGLHVRLVGPEDAEFIISIRANDKVNRLISHVDADVDNQRKWILNYKERERNGKEYYFIFTHEGKKLGVYRLYDITEDSFTCGSWVFSPDAPKGAAILGCIIGREIAFDTLGLIRCFNDTKHINNSSMQFQKSFNPVIIKDDGETVWFEHTKEKFNNKKTFYINLCSKLLKK